MFERFKAARANYNAEKAKYVAPRELVGIGLLPWVNSDPLKPSFLHALRRELSIEPLNFKERGEILTSPSRPTPEAVSEVIAVLEGERNKLLTQAEKAKAKKESLAQKRVWGWVNDLRQSFAESKAALAKGDADLRDKLIADLQEGRVGRVRRYAMSRVNNAVYTMYPVKHPAYRYDPISRIMYLPEALTNPATLATSETSKDALAALNILKMITPDEELTKRIFTPLERELKRPKFLDIPEKKLRRDTSK